VNDRHANISNVEELDAMQTTEGTRFGARIRRLGLAAGSQELGCNWFEVEPGRAAFPCHYHCGIEEALFVLDGTGTLRLGDGEYNLRAGDWVTFLAGPDHAHQVINTGERPLRYLCISSRAGADVVGYPDSNKVAAIASPSVDFFATPWVREIYRAGTGVGYYDGEETE
jgi:uncharacterized cupin superfamily protein